MTTPTEPPQSLPPAEYEAAITRAIDQTLGRIRADLGRGKSEEEVFSRLFMLLIKSDPPEGDSDRMHGLAAAALVRLAKSLEVR